MVAVHQEEGNRVPHDAEKLFAHRLAGGFYPGLGECGCVRLVILFPHESITQINQKIGLIRQNIGQCALPHGRFIVQVMGVRLDVEREGLPPCPLRAEEPLSPRKEQRIPGCTIAQPVGIALIGQQ